MFPLLPLMAAISGSHTPRSASSRRSTAVHRESFSFRPVMAERWGEYALLALGNGWGAAGLLGMAAATSFPVLLVLAVLAGLGGNFQHPCASTMVARPSRVAGGAPRSARSTSLATSARWRRRPWSAVRAAVRLASGAAGARDLWDRVLSRRLAVQAVGQPAAAEPAAPLAPSSTEPPWRIDADERATTRPNHVDDGLSRLFGGVPPAFYLLHWSACWTPSTRSAGLTFLPFALEQQGSTVWGSASCSVCSSWGVPSASCCVAPSATVSGRSRSSC